VAQRACKIFPADQKKSHPCSRAAFLNPNDSVTRIFEKKFPRPANKKLLIIFKPYSRLVLPDFTQKICNIASCACYFYINKYIFQNVRPISMNSVIQRRLGLHPTTRFNLPRPIGGSQPDG